jgi:ATP-dependent helicase/nuclease subunit A
MIFRYFLQYFEVPFVLKEAGSIVHGVIDLIFREAGGWVIVDYKTDDFEKDKERKKAYTRQVELYKKYWEMISGEKVKETSLYKLA